MGEPRDMVQRKILARTDGVNYRITVARAHIYEKNYAVNSTAVERLLKVDSLVPTEVCNILLPAEYLRRFPFPERILKQTGTCWFLPIQHASCRSSA